MKESDRWATPPEVFDPLNAEFNFTLDACAELETAKCRRYFTPTDDGLKQPWAGEVVWLNPPYSRGEPGSWLGKAWKETKAGATVVALVPHDPSTKWWQTWVKALRDGQDPAVQVEVREWPSRIRFLKPDGSPAKSGYPKPCAVVIYRPTNVDAPEGPPAVENNVRVLKDGQSARPATPAGFVATPCEGPNCRRFTLQPPLCEICSRPKGGEA